MKSLLIGICERSVANTELIIQYLKIAEACLSMNLQVRTFSTGKSFLESYHPIFDTLFLNLPMPDVDSKTLLERIRQRDTHVNIVLFSQSTELFPLGYEYSAKNFFVKPLCYSKILNELKKQLADETVLSKPHIWISNQHGDYKIYLHRLRYIETCNRKIILHYGNEQIYHNKSLSEFQKNLPTDFFRCNNSYIININYIGKILQDLSRHVIYLVTEEQLPLSRKKKSELERILLLSDKSFY